MTVEGIAMDWRHVIDWLIRKDRLLLPQRPKSGDEFHLIWPGRAELSESARRVRD